MTATFLLAERFDGIGPWTEPQVLFLLGYALLVRGSIDIFFNYNVAFISRRIGRGQLDHLLIQPQPLWMVLLTEGFAPVTGTGMFFPGLGTADLVGQPAATCRSRPPGWLLLAIDLVASIAVVLAFAYIFGSLAFWAPRAAEEINSSTWRAAHPAGAVSARRPVRPGAGQPADGRAGRPGSVVSVRASCSASTARAWAPLLRRPAARARSPRSRRWIFRRGLRHYGRTGSTRYLDYGHRR